ncbi:hypothetical protein [Rheinheimera sp.]|uniref:hypothetical protein n=1 Tax=Rheinheimera sp. TaxID=1869214 RepID=UPI0027327A58|nr:hypothetical protein [Rheinheimera sp.]MDP2714945.1 hypothetical protein [Rheinheimera sp.]
MKLTHEVYMKIVFPSAIIFLVLAFFVSGNEGERIPHDSYYGEYLLGEEVHAMHVAFNDYAKVTGFHPLKNEMLYGLFKFKVISSESVFLVVIVRDMDSSFQKEDSFIYGSGGEFKVSKDNFSVIDYVIYK